MPEQIFELSISLITQTCVYLVIAYLLSRTRLFLPFMHVTVRLPQRAACYVVFSLFCIMGTYLGLGIDGVIANTRAIGAVLSGIIGGPEVGFLVGLTGALHRYWLGGRRSPYGRGRSWDWRPVRTDCLPGAHRACCPSSCRRPRSM